MVYFFISIAKYTYKETLTLYCHLLVSTVNSYKINLNFKMKMALYVHKCHDGQFKIRRC